MNGRECRDCHSNMSLIMLYRCDNCHLTEVHNEPVFQQNPINYANYQFVDYDEYSDELDDEYPDIDNILERYNPDNQYYQNDLINHRNGIVESPRDTDELEIEISNSSDIPTLFVRYDL